jgi:hypothetical protein
VSILLLSLLKFRYRHCNLMQNYFVPICNEHIIQIIFLLRVIIPLHTDDKGAAKSKRLRREDNKMCYVSILAQSFCICKPELYLKVCIFHPLIRINKLLTTCLHHTLPLLLRNNPCTNKLSLIPHSAVPCSMPTYIAYFRSQ